jgi:hypothetical protein
MNDNSKIPVGRHPENLSVDDGKAVEKSKLVSNPSKKRREPTGN